MPAVTVYLSTEDLIRLRDEGDKREMSRSALLKERMNHKCPPAKESKPCDQEHILDGEWIYPTRTRPGKKKGTWIEERLNADADGYEPSK